MNYKALKILNPFRPKKIVVLMYHRIANLAIDPWQLSVSPAHFEEHLRLLTKKYHVISTDELGDILKSKASIPARTVCITFDDGYKDNYNIAKPLLEVYQCATTFFISTNYLENQQLFWWDELQLLTLESHALPRKIEINIRGEQLYFTIEGEEKLTAELALKHSNWQWPAEPPTKRAALYLAIWERLKPAPYNEIQKTLQALKDMNTSAPDSREHLPMTPSQLKSLAVNSLFKIGLHTNTHLALGSQSFQLQKEDIMQNKQKLEEECNYQMDTISYPYGNYNTDTLKVVEDFQLKTGFTTKGKAITRQSNRSQLGRYQVNNWNKDEFKMKLSQWLR